MKAEYDDEYGQGMSRTGVLLAVGGKQESAPAMGALSQRTPGASAAVPVIEIDLEHLQLRLTSAR